MGEMEVGVGGGDCAGAPCRALCSERHGACASLRELSESNTVTDDQTRQSQGNEWLRAAVDNWALYD